MKLIQFHGRVAGHSTNAPVVLAGVLVLIMAIALPLSADALSTTASHAFNLASPQPLAPLSGEVTVSLSYAIVGGGVNYTVPVLHYVSGGLPVNATLTTTLTPYQMDGGSVWTVPPLLQGRTSAESWQTSSATSEVATQGFQRTYSYIHEFLAHFLYTVSGGSRNFNPPTVSYTFLGKPQHQTAFAVVWADAGTSYNYTQVIPSISASERWATNSGIGNVTAPVQATPVYYHQYLATLDYSIQGGGLPAAPTFSYLAMGQQSIPAQIPSVPLQIWADANSAYSSTNPLPSSDPTERWLTGPSSSGILTSSVVLALTYYHQYMITANYSIVGGNSPTTVSFAGRSAGSPITYALTTTTKGYWLDAGTMYKIPTLIESSFGERWDFPGLNTSVVFGPTTLNNLVYYHQYSFSLSYSIVGGGAPTLPVLNYTSFGSHVRLTLPAGLFSSWADNGTSVDLTNPLLGSSPKERWVTAVSDSLIVAPVDLSLTYYHQYELGFSYSFADGASTNSPTLHAVSFGTPMVFQLSSSGSSLWLDAGTSWNLNATIAGTTSQERWVTSLDTAGAVSKPVSLAFQFQHQFFVNILPAPEKGGSTEPQSGWFNPNSTLVLSAVANDSWQFEGWNGTGAGSYTGHSANTTLEVKGGFLEAAQFYPSVSVISPSGGSVTYAIGSDTGTLGGGKTLVEYVPLGTLVTLSASTSALFALFTGWTGGNFGTTNPLTISVSSPVTISPSYGVDTVLRGVAVAAVALVVIFLVGYIILTRDIPFVRAAKWLRRNISRDSFQYPQTLGF